ncbi:MAG: hypothetical protein NTV79_01915 [Candidatus Aureabacteria bacterium]|nr:hypothetical protein [Candidatus Auribacterota bacterium]
MPVDLLGPGIKLFQVGVQVFDHPLFEVETAEQILHREIVLLQTLPVAIPFVVLVAAGPHPLHLGGDLDLELAHVLHQDGKFL